MSTQPDNSHAQRHSGILQELQDEAISIAKISGEALMSFAWFWPIRGILYTATRGYFTCLRHKQTF
jgi:hypothetical protein